MSTAAPAKQSRPGQYEVARPGHVCFTCQQPIEPGDKMMAALRETPQGFERLDFCTKCGPEFDRKDLIGFWKTVLPKHEAKKKMFVDDAVLAEIFERLADTTESPKLNFRFVLGLILMRKRMVIYDSTRYEGEKEIWSVRMKGKDGSLDLLNPRLDETQVTEVSQQLNEILNESL